MARKLLRDDQYKRIAGMLPAQPGDPGRKSDNRLFLEAVLWIARSGAPWRDLPPEFGEWNTVYQRFGRWSKKGVWHTVFAELAQDADFEEAFIDSTIIKAHQHAAGAQKNGRTSAWPLARRADHQVHALVEGLGLMARWTLTGGQVHDSGQAVPLLEGLHPDAVVADKAYDADALIVHIREIGAAAVIPPRTNRLEQRSFDKHQYKHRNLIERFFLRIKQFRRIATRYDKLAERFSSFIAIVATFLWLA